MQAHPSLKALAVKGHCSEPLVKGAVAGMSKRGNVEKLIVQRRGRDPLLVCRQYAVSNGAWSQVCQSVISISSGSKEKQCVVCCTSH